MTIFNVVKMSDSSYLLQRFFTTKFLSLDVNLKTIIEYLKKDFFLDRRLLIDSPNLNSNYMWGGGLCF